MARDRANQENPDDVPSTVTPSSALEDTLEEHLGIYPGEAAAIGHEGAHEAHEPSEHSFWPITVAAAVLLIGVGLLSHYLVSVAGVVVLMVALVGWFTEPWVS